MKKGKKEKRRKGEKIYVWEKRKKIWVWVKIKWAPRFSKVHWEFQGFKIKRSKLISPTMCNPITRTSFVPRDHSLPFAHVRLSQVCVFFSLPPWINIIFQWPYWRVSVRPREACLVLTTSHLYYLCRTKLSQKAPYKAYHVYMLWEGKE
jgi:hypothetical protein